MIPGDIDLTKNLDFRKTVRKKIPQFPANWTRGEITISNKFSYTPISSTYLNSSIYHNIRIDDNVSLTIYNTYGNDLYDIDIMYDRVDNYYINSYYDEFDTFDDISSYTTHFNYTNGTISTNSSTTTYGTYLTSIREGVSTSQPYTYKYLEKDEYDVFGNKIKKKKEYAPPIPWKSKQPERIKSIPWSTCEARKSYFRYLYGSRYHTNKRIPWDTTSRKKQHDLDNLTTRAQCLIAWLKDKSHSFIKKYFDKENNDDLSYLTNMSWIRVKDAVID